MDESESANEAAPTSKWRTRLEGHTALLGLAGLGLTYVFYRAENEIALAGGIFPMVVGWLLGVIALEVNLARGVVAAVRKSVLVQIIASVANILLVSAVIYYLKIR